MKLSKCLACGAEAHEMDPIEDCCILCEHAVISNAL